MILRATAAGVALSFLTVTASFAVLSDPIPIGAGEVLAQYEAKPTDAQKRICEKNGGEVTQLNNGKWVCVRRPV